MKLHPRRRSCRCLKTLVLGAALLASLGGCPVDGNAVLTAAVQAGLNSATTTATSVLQAVLNAATQSFVDSLSTYLAGK